MPQDGLGRPQDASQTPPFEANTRVLVSLCSQEVSKTFQSAFKKVRDVYRRLFQELPRRYQELPRCFQTAPRAIRKPPSDLQEVSKRILRVPKALSRGLQVDFKRPPNGLQEASRLPRQLQELAKRFQDLDVGAIWGALLTLKISKIRILGTSFPCFEGLCKTSTSIPRYS